MVAERTRLVAMHGTNRAATTPLPSSGLSGSAIREAARQYVADGEALATFLADLEVAHQALHLPSPGKELVKAASLAWADEILAKLDDVACENPLTGMSSAEHARIHLRTLYQTGDAERTTRVLDAHALVIVSLFESDPAAPKACELEAAFDQSLRLATVGETIRATFERCDVLATMQPGRVLAVVSRDQFLENRAEELAWLLRRRLPISSAPRVHVDTMPPTEDAACALLDDLTA